MSTITAIIEPDADGMLRLPVPPGWGRTPVRVKAELEPLGPAETSPEPAVPEPLKGFGWLRGRISMTSDFEEPLEDFNRLLVAQARVGGLTLVSCDPHFAAYGVAVLW